MKITNILIGVCSLLLSSGLAMANSCIGTCVVYTVSTPMTEADFFGSAYGPPAYSNEYIFIERSAIGGSGRIMIGLKRPRQRQDAVANHQNG